MDVGTVTKGIAVGAFPGFCAAVTPGVCDCVKVSNWTHWAV